MDVSGYWNSTLTYGEGYHALEGKTISCELQLQQVGLSFMGSSQDILGEGCHPEEAVITGRISRDNEISFTKNYPCLHGVDKRGELILYPKIPGPDISFTGRYNEDEDQFEGEWAVTMKMHLLGIIPKRYTSKGQWVMRKVL